MGGLEGKDDIAAVDVLRISAKTGFQVDLLKEAMVASVRSYWEGSQNPEATIISNARHLHALRQTYESLISAREAMGIGMSGDLVSIDIRAALYHMGSITGEISTDEILGIFLSGSFVSGRYGGGIWWIFYGIGEVVIFLLEEWGVRKGVDFQGQSFWGWGKEAGVGEGCWLFFGESLIWFKDQQHGQAANKGNFSGYLCEFERLCGRREAVCAVGGPSGPSAGGCFGGFAVVWACLGGCGSCLAWNACANAAVGWGIGLQ